MKKCRITVVKVTEHTDLMARYENPMLHACDLREGQVFIANGWMKPEGLCDSAWSSLSPFVMTLAHGGENLYEGWMKNPALRHDLLQRRFPSSRFYIEALYEDAD